MDYARLVNAVMGDLDVRLLFEPGRMIAGNAGIASVPGSAEVQSATTNGGMGLGITSTCRHPDVAWDFIQHLASRPVQKQWAQLSLPIWKSLYEDAELLQAQPVLLRAAKEQYPFMVNRPALPYYSAASTILSWTKLVRAAGTPASRKSS